MSKTIIKYINGYYRIQLHNGQIIEKDLCHRTAKALLETGAVKNWDLLENYETGETYEPYFTNRKATK